MPNSVELDALNLTNKFKNVELDFSFPIYYILTILDCKLLSFALSRFIRVWCQKARRFPTCYIPISIITNISNAGFFPPNNNKTLTALSNLSGISFLRCPIPRQHFCKIISRDAKYLFAKKHCDSSVSINIIESIFSFYILFTCWNQNCGFWVRFVSRSKIDFKS